MLVSKAARRYAIALLEMCKEKNLVQQTLNDILFVQKTIDDSRELQSFLKSPIIKPSVKKETLEAVFNEHVKELTVLFISLVAKKERAGLLHEIVTAFVQEYNKFAGIIEVEVRTAQVLNDTQINELQKVLEKTTSKKVNLHTIVQDELQGGILVKIDDTVIDGTVKHKLEQLEERLLDNTVELN
jgi:F-type H+-transporting ATPase subunit delta